MDEPRCLTGVGIISLAQLEYANTMDEQAAYDELFELDRRLRTGKYKSQIEAIVSIPLFFQKIQSDPVLIGTTYLRIVDYFCGSTNELRSHLLRSLFQGEIHLYSKSLASTQAEEMVKRLGVVWESNDILAKSLVVRFYGLLSEGLASNNAARAGVLYRIGESLSSIHDEEVDSALDTTLCLVNALDANLVVTVVVDALLKILHSSSIFSHRIPKLLTIFSIPSYDAPSDLQILCELQSWKDSYPTSLYRDTDEQTKKLIATIIERLGIAAYDQDYTQYCDCSNDHNTQIV